MSRKPLDTALKASCAAQIVLGADGTAPKWLQLIPAGTFNTNDGRSFTVADPRAVIAASKAEIHIDYDHGTDTGKSSRAAGWSEELKDSGPNGEPGIWARMHWTKSGAAAIAEKEFRFISPTFLHDKQNVVTKILRAGLLNNPAIDELPALASQQENDELDQLKQIASALGLPDTATLSDVLAAITARANTNAAMCKSIGAVATAAGLTKKPEEIGDTEVTAICAKLNATASAGDQQTIATLSGQVSELRTRILELTAKDLAKTAEQKVSDAIAAGKLAPAQKDDALALCKSDPVAFDKFITGAPTIVTTGRLSREDTPAGELSAEEKAICASMGVKEEDFKAELKARKEQGL
jgi:phage I-like protein